MAALRGAIGQPAGEPPAVEALEQLTVLSGSVTASGGSSFTVRVQKHLAAQNASDDDLASVLSKAGGGGGDGLLQALRAMQLAHEMVHGAKAKVELNKRCCVLAAKAQVLVRCGLISKEALAPAAAATERALQLVLQKERRVRPPRGPTAPRLLPGAVAVDTEDPFHMELSSAVRGIASTLGAALERRGG